GYFAPNTHVPVASSLRGEGGCCALNSEGIQGVVDAFLEYIDERGISTYDEKSHSGLVRHLVVRKVGETFSICVVVNGDSLPNYKALVKRLEERGYKFSLYISINKKRTNVIMGEKTVTLFGKDTLEGEALGVKFAVSPQSFMQVNDEVRDLIYSKVGEIIKASEIENVVDAYSGIGIMSNIFAGFCEKVYAVEIVKEAVENSKQLAKLNGNSHKIISICGDCARELPPLIARLDKSIVVLDPPRKGCDESVLESILKSMPTKIIYISCNPATLARDIKRLLEKYEIESVTPYDMFPQTKHIETLICLKRKKTM
ncbi:MAG: 23S rRNA (uracil(1939)-C(5))-methyltransferase RlmD, partial [Clostridia bacterium]|nr:23S rRNA (uracil(1939)-C(5))-methyltransferase RlmD [Clostridia bacterium]